MSIVGPRPNVEREVNLYTEKEKVLLSVKPGITDLTSIVFADEGEILENSKNPDLDYNQLIRPLKNHLALIYIEKSSIYLYFIIIILTALSLISRKKSIFLLEKTLKYYNISKQIILLSKRLNPLKPMPPPGLKK